MSRDPGSINADLWSALRVAASMRCAHSLCILWMRCSQSLTASACSLASAAAAQHSSRLTQRMHSVLFLTMQAPACYDETGRIVYPCASAHAMSHWKWQPMRVPASPEAAAAWVPCCAARRASVALRASSAQFPCSCCSCLCSNARAVCACASSCSITGSSLLRGERVGQSLRAWSLPGMYSLRSMATCLSPAWSTVFDVLAAIPAPQSEAVVA